MSTTTWLAIGSLIEALGTHVWQSTLWVVATASVTRALRANRAEVRYRLWLAASVKFIVPLSLLVTLGGLVPWRSSASIVWPATPPIIDAIRQPVSWAMGGAVPRHAVTASLRAPGGPGNLRFAGIAVIALIAVWLIGCAVSVLTWLVRWRRLVALAGQGAPVERGPHLDMLRRLARQSGIRQPIALVSVDTMLEPGVFGIVRPVVLWPRPVDRLSEEHVEAILAHEVAHVRRRDNLAAAVHMVVQALFWFHPLVWWVGARLIDERERACDEAVIHLGSAPGVYARSLLEICRACVQSPLPCVAGVTGSHLGRRIERILSARTAAVLSPWRRMLIGTVVAMAMGGPVVAGMIGASSLQAQYEGPQLPRRGFGPPDVNRLVGFELLPGPVRRSGDDPVDAVAWDVTVNRASSPLVMRGFTARALIRYAYALGDTPLVFPHRWMFAETFAVSANASADASEDEVRAVLRQVLSDRFHLSAHHETRPVPVYALVTVNGPGAIGLNVRPSTSACLEAAAVRDAAARGVRLNGARFCGVETRWSGLAFERVTMTEIADALVHAGPGLDRSVVDRTGITGAFDGVLSVGVWPAAAIATRHPETAPVLSLFGVRSLFTALPEQLGLALVEATTPADVFVVDHAERPAGQ